MGTSLADLILRNVWQQGDKAGSQNGDANGTMPFGTGSGSAARENSTIAIDERLQRPQVFVVDINWSRSFFRAIRAEAAGQLLLQAGLFLTSLTDFGKADSTHNTHLECVLIWWEKSASIYVNWPQIAPRKSSFRALAKIAHQKRSVIMEAGQRSFNRSSPGPFGPSPKPSRPAGL
jgi:hypothetical protein